MGRSGRLFLLLRPYALLFVGNLVATFVASVLDGATFVLLIPFLRALFGHEALPAVGGRNPVRIRIVVVLPAPLGPRKPTIWPFSTSNEMSLTATVRAYRFVRPSTLIICNIPKLKDVTGRKMVTPN